MASNPSAPPEVSNDALSGNTKAEMSTAQPEIQPPPYTVQQNVAAPYPTDPAMAKYPTPMDPQPQPGVYPQPQPGVYPQPQTVAYHAPQPGMAAPTSGNAVVITQPGVATSGHVIVTQADVYPSSVGAIVFSCIVAWLCCCVFGLAAFIVAILSSDASSAQEARQRLKIANGLSIAGLICGIFLWIIVIAT